MSTGYAARLFIVIALIGTMASVVADKSEHFAAIVKANAETKAFLKKQDIEGALRNAASTYNLSVDTLGKKSPNTANLAVIYAQLLGATGDKHKALKLYEEAVNTLESLYGEDDLRLVPPLLEMGQYARQKDKLPIVERAIVIHKTQAPEDHLDYANVLRSAGEYLVQHRQSRVRAQEIIIEALAIYEAEYGEDAPELINSLMLLGNASARWGKSGTPKYYYKRALKIADNKLTPEEYATLLQRTGESLMRYSASRDSIRYLKKAYQSFESLYGSKDRRTAMSAFSVGRYYMAASKENRAEPYLTQALDFISTDPNYRNHHLSVLSLLVQLHERQGNRDEATPYCQAIGEISPWTNTQDYKPIFKLAPKYPSSAVSARSQGYAVVEYTVNSNGFVQNPKVVDMKGHGSFEKASLEAALQFRYAPAFVDGKPVDTPGVRNKFTYQLSP